jgi:hypothetical protein
MTKEERRQYNKQYREKERRRVETLVAFFDEHQAWLNSHGDDLSAKDIVFSLLVTIHDVVKMAEDFEGLQEELMKMIVDMFPKILTDVDTRISHPTLH